MYLSLVYSVSKKLLFNMLRLFLKALTLILAVLQNLILHNCCVMLQVGVLYACWNRWILQTYSLHSLQHY